mmetsp:Transcript_57593/g.102214  ORF Transcript_57593/g.102214 Transcript_57593/m.102214 type:complete len:131 (+) Transcript_57593:2-394(+)
MPASVIHACCALACVLGALSTALLAPSCESCEVFQAVQLLAPAKTARESVVEALAQGEQFRQCPSCEVMVEREGGCNVIACPNCNATWCFACGGSECLPWSCARLQAASSRDINELPRLLWPRSAILLVT